MSHLPFGVASEPILFGFHLPCPASKFPVRVRSACLARRGQAARLAQAATGPQSRVNRSRTTHSGGPTPPPLLPIPQISPEVPNQFKVRPPSSQIAGDDGPPRRDVALVPPNPSHPYPSPARHRVRRFLLLLAAGGRHPGRLCREKGMYALIFSSPWVYLSSPRRLVLLPFLNHISQAVRLLARVKWITAIGPFY